MQEKEGKFYREITERRKYRWGKIMKIFCVLQKINIW